MASMISTASLGYLSFERTNRSNNGVAVGIGNGATSACVVKEMRVEKPLEELYSVRVEREVLKERLTELGVSRWSVWKTGKCKLPWDWQVDQLVYIEEGEVRVVPEGSDRFMQFVAGDLVRYPKWFEADLYFNGPYQERYSFLAYGDD
ncbi:Phosphatase 2A regulatory B subunit family protein, GAMMA [Hibiscus syriacus]|uniref:Phosphatase 2A regulatory B subunit family protein, GAMMA n=1 Tax=Hibiscus syriacus TaxID=106335 RepID=A0A6A2Z1V1_HIBSY|nr:uncharacterized protein LOC120152411 [Hibiscus syriacus]KAE8685894.1 Phosphatase 2A regulatory B subunit family protein, GAMMA [Hibiscus syriacus]